MAKSKNNSLYSSAGFKLLLLITIATLSVLGAKNLIENSGSKVLGTNTFIAEGGSDSGSSSPENNTQATIAGPTGTQQKIEPTDTPEVKTPEPTDVPEIHMENLNKVRFESENGKTQLHLEQGNSKLEISNENGNLSIKAKNQDGTELQLQQENSLEKLNEALKDEDVEVGTGAGNLLTIRKGDVQADTHFPISINPTTNTLTITTPAGVKNVTVLPNTAVQNLLQQGVINQVQTTTSATNGAQLQHVTLGLLNNNPVFQVQGSDAQKFLGLIPVNIQKTSFVSAENGKVVQVDETFLNQLLDLLSVQ